MIIGKFSPVAQFIARCQGLVSSTV